MSAKVILLCGKICSGKTMYLQGLRRERKAMVLSCDDLMLALLDEHLGERHDEISARAQNYLLRQAAELSALEVPVILDWGFWTTESRRSVEDFFRSQELETEWHYLDISEEAWRRNIEKRNRERPAGSYFVDQNLAEKCAALFEPPLPEEIDVWVHIQ